MSKTVSFVAGRKVRVRAAFCIFAVLILASRAHADSPEAAICAELAASISALREKDWFKDRSVPANPTPISRSELAELLPPPSIDQLELSDYHEPTIKKLDLDGDGETETVVRRSETCATDWILRMEPYGGASILGKVEGDSCLGPVQYVTTAGHVFAVVQRDNIGVNLPVYETLSFRAGGFRPVCRVVAIEAQANTFTECRSAICVRVAQNAAALIQNGGHLPAGNFSGDPLPDLWDDSRQRRIPTTRAKLIDFDNDGHVDLLAQTDVDYWSYHQGFFRRIEGEWVKIDLLQAIAGPIGYRRDSFDMPGIGHRTVAMLEENGTVYWVVAEQKEGSYDSTKYRLTISELRSEMPSEIGEVSARFTSRTTRVEMFAPQAP